MEEKLIVIVGRAKCNLTEMEYLAKDSFPGLQIIKPIEKIVCHPQDKVDEVEYLIQDIVDVYEEPVILMTMDPYILQAIRYYSATFKIRDRIAYYIVDMDENNPEDIIGLHCITHDLNQAFSQLAIPLNKIINLPHDKQRKEQEE